MFWTSAQRRGLGLLLGVILAALAVMLIRNPSSVPLTPPEDGPRAAEVQARIDPNIASADELAALPGIGPSVARRIVREREVYAREHPGRAAFRRLEDLDRIAGVGEMTLKTLEPYLEFPRGQ